MELKDFISETLKQIIDGVSMAQVHSKEKKALVNPPEIAIVESYKQMSTTVYSRNRDGQFTEFDIAVTASEDKQAKGGAGVFVAPLSLGSQVQKDISSSTVSRIKFRVPLFLPESS